MDASNKARKEALARLGVGNIDLADELNEILKVVKYQRESLTNSMVSGFGYKQDELNPKHAALARDLVMAYQKAVDAKVKLDKHLRSFAEDMTLEEELDSVEKYIKDLDSTKRRKLLISLLEFHNANVTNTSWLIKSC